MSDPVLDPLNEKQREAVTHGEGPLLILAGAGSGKTRAITHRMAHLIRDREVPPHRILGVTFTNKAADEMKERAGELVGEHHLQPTLSTFHSFGVEFLREEAAALDRSRSFTIYDTGDQRALLRECMEEEGIDPKALKPKEVAGRISRAKDDLLTPDRYEVEREGGDGRVVRLYRRYQERLRENNAYDFGDLIMKPVRVLRRSDTVRKRWTEGSRAFRYLLIDEFQDTNPAQYRLASILAEAHSNLTAVGDDDQSIYSWRGADVSNILEFEDDFPDTTVVRLEQNYRSTQPILDAAQRVIENNDSRRGKTLWTQQEQGPEPTVHAARRDYDEAEYVASTIRTLEKIQGIAPGECAVFVRTNAQTRVFEEVFMRENLPYLIVSGVGFYERKEIKDLMAYLNVLVNPQDDHSLKRIINTPSRGIGKKTLGSLEAAADAGGVGLLEALDGIEDDESISGRARSSLSAFRDVYRDLADHREDPPDQVLEAVLERTSYLEKEVESEDEETALRRRENIDELLRVAETFSRERAEPELAEFVEEISLLTDVDTFDEGSSRVKLMTLHAAKGLEFPVVFMAGMEEGLLPHQNAEYDPERMEEERRLCYVGFTRARQRLYCTWSRSRWMYGSERHHDPSRFLEEADLLEEKEETEAAEDPFRAPDLSAGNGEPGTGGPEPSTADDGVAVNLSEGDAVRHPRFGEGTVLDMTGSDTSPVAHIRFDSGEEKRLAVTYAELEVV